MPLKVRSRENKIGYCGTPPPHSRATSFPPFPLTPLPFIKQVGALTACDQKSSEFF